jgi:hypothetical protein
MHCTFCSFASNMQQWEHSLLDSTVEWRGNLTDAKCLNVNIQAMLFEWTWWGYGMKYCWMPK